MRAGQLRHKIVIQQAAYATDAYGGRIPTWSFWAYRQADVSPIDGREAQYAKTIAATVSHKVTIRYTPGVDPTMRLVFGTRVFAINAVLNVDERNREHGLYCTEIIGQAATGTLSPP